MFLYFCRLKIWLKVVVVDNKYCMVYKFLFIEGYVNCLILLCLKEKINYG